MSIWNTDGSQTGVRSGIALASPGDMVLVPSGTFIWGSGNTQIVIGKRITLAGAGTGITNIVLASTAPTQRDGTVYITGGGTLSGMSFTLESDTMASWVTASAASGWRVCYCSWISWPAATYVSACISAWTPGLIDHNFFSGTNGQQENVWCKKFDYNTPWSLPAQYGSADAVYVEDNVWGGAGYVTDNQDGANIVVRFNTIRGNNKVDQHGRETTNRAGRLVEVYNNNWDSTVANVEQMIALRGGTAMVFDNIGPRAIYPTAGYFLLQDYAVTNNSLNFPSGYNTPVNWPSLDQVGIGPDPARIGGAEPVYVWNNLRSGVLWPIAGAGGYAGFASTNPASASYQTDALGYATGSTVINLQICGGTITQYDYLAFSGDDNRYAVATGRGPTTGSIVLAAPGLLQAIPATPTTMWDSAITKYQFQTSNPVATFDTIGAAQPCMIQYNRDVFSQYSTFDGSSGVGRGTKEQMEVITPTTTGVAYWVTNEGSWNSTVPANTAGQLYRWNGTGWALYYTPYPYPHPLRGFIPVGYKYARLGGHIKLKGLTRI